MAYLTEPNKIIMNFLRANITELTRTQPSGLSNRQTADSENFTGNAVLVEFTLTEVLEVVCINSVTVAGSTMIPYEDYNIDLDNKKIKFITAPADQAAIVVSYDKGSSWIYPDMPRSNLKLDQYPRIAIRQISESAGFRELGSTNTLNQITFQLDILTFKDLFCTISSESKEGPDVTDYLARQVILQLASTFVAQLLYKARDYRIIDNSPAPFEPNKNLFRKIVQITMLFRNLEDTP